MYKGIVELYATSIIAGRWKLEKVPAMFKEQVIKRIDEIKVEKGENK
jgi:hypothetical protein|nr:MAG TPA: hypothetical protein [Caudoviricetes sp.]